MLTFIDRFDWILLLAVLPLIIYFNPLSALLLALVVAVILGARALNGQRLLDRTPLDIPLLLIVIMIGVSLWATFDRSYSLPKVVGLLHGIALYVVVARQIGRDQRALLVALPLFLAAGGALVLVGILGGGLPSGSKLPGLGAILSRLPGQIIDLPVTATNAGVNPNEVGGLLTWLTPLATTLALLAIVRARDIPANRRAVVITLTALTAGFFNLIFLLVQSRSAILGYAVALLLLGAIALRNRRGILLGAVVATIIAAGILVFTGALGTISGLIGSNQVDIAGNALDSLAGRQEIWSRAIYAIQDYPLTGTGMNMFRRIIHSAYPLFLVSPTVDLGHAHNHLLQAALDLGIPGLVGYMGIWISGAWALWRIWQHDTSLWLQWIASGIAASLLAFFVFGMSDAIALGAKPGFLFWSLWGMLIGIHQLATQREGVEHSPNAASRLLG